MGFVSSFCACCCDPENLLLVRQGKAGQARLTASGVLLLRNPGPNGFLKSHFYNVSLLLSWHPGMYCGCCFHTSGATGAGAKEAHIGPDYDKRGPPSAEHYRYVSSVLQCPSASKPLLLLSKTHEATSSPGSPKQNSSAQILSPRCPLVSCPGRSTAMVKAEKARSVEDMLIAAATSGRLGGKVTEHQFIQMLEQVMVFPVPNSRAQRNNVPLCR